MIIFPVSRIPLKFFSLSTSKYEIFADNPWFWYISLLATGIYLLLLWEKTD
jgi:hypothetical protein